MQKRLKSASDSADCFSVIVNEQLVREVLHRTCPEDREHMLTIVEAYRLCVDTVRRLRRKSKLRDQRSQAIECAEYCERVLEEFVDQAPPREIQFPPLTIEDSHLVVTIRW